MSCQSTQTAGFTRNRAKTKHNKHGDASTHDQYNHSLRLQVLDGKDFSCCVAKYPNRENVTWGWLKGSKWQIIFIMSADKRTRCFITFFCNLLMLMTGDSFFQKIRAAVFMQFIHGSGERLPTRAAVFMQGIPPNAKRLPHPGPLARGLRYCGHGCNFSVKRGCSYNPNF